MGRVSQPEKREKSHGRETASGWREREGRRWEEGGKERAKEGKKVGGGWRGRKTNEPRNKRGIGAIDGSGVWPEGNEEGMRGRS